MVEGDNLAAPCACVPSYSIPWLALETAALEDPFLADAIDGYQQSGVNARSADQELKQALEDRLTGPRNNRLIPAWLKIAAAVAVLVTTVVGITIIINLNMVVSFPHSSFLTYFDDLRF